MGTFSLRATLRSTTMTAALWPLSPELGKANPRHFGVALATIDGHVYEVGDSGIEFTIQSISKAFIFALALETIDQEQIEACVGVEPSGEAFNSIRLNGKNQPFNPMVNAGAIACSGLIYQQEREVAFERIPTCLAGLRAQAPIDEQVYASESTTGDRNRAIAWLLRNYAVIKDDVDAVLDVYFRQCSVLVTARDLAVMAATLANGGVNPLTGVRVISPYSVARTLSVMTSSGRRCYGRWCRPRRRRSRCRAEHDHSRSARGYREAGVCRRA